MMLSTKDAAKILNINDSRVRQLILSGRLPAKKMGRDWLIEQRDIETVKDRKPGRPKKGVTKKVLSQAEKDDVEFVRIRILGVKEEKVNHLKQVLKDFDWLREIIEDQRTNFRHDRLIHHVNVMRAGAIEYVKLKLNIPSDEFYSSYRYLSRRLFLIEDTAPEVRGILGAIFEHLYSY